MGVLVGLGAPDNTIALIDLSENDSKAVQKFKYHSSEVSGIINLGDGKFVSCGYDGFIVCWDISNPSACNPLKAHEGRVTSITTLNNNTTLVSAGDDCMIRVYSLKNGQLQMRGSFRESAPISIVSSFYGNSRFIVSCLTNGLIKIWNVENGE